MQLSIVTIVCADAPFLSSLILIHHHAVLAFSPYIKTGTDVIHIMLFHCLGTVYAFSALTLLAGHQEEHPAYKTGVMRCWCGYLSEARCRLFAYGPADVTAIPKSPCHLLPHLNPDWFCLSGTGLPGCPEKRPLNGCSSSRSIGLVGTYTRLFCQFTGEPQ